MKSPPVLHQSFLAWQASQKSGDTSLAASGLSLSSEPGIQLPKPLCRAPRFEDSDGDLGPEPEHDLTDQDCPAGVPAWKSDGPAETRTVAETAAPSKATPACADVRFLLSSSGIAHLSIFHSGSRMLCLACRSDSCTFRCQPACHAAVFQISQPLQCYLLVPACADVGHA